MYLLYNNSKDLSIWLFGGVLYYHIIIVEKQCSDLRYLILNFNMIKTYLFVDSWRARLERFKFIELDRQELHTHLTNNISTV